MSLVRLLSSCRYLRPAALASTCRPFMQTIRRASTANGLLADRSNGCLISTGRPFCSGMSMTSVVDEEMQRERKNEQELPRVGDFEMHLRGASVTLKKQLPNGSVVKVFFNVNNSFDEPDFDEFEDTAGPSPNEMEDERTSRSSDMSHSMAAPVSCQPPFTVEIAQPGGRPTLSMHCSFISGDGDFDENMSETLTPEDNQRDRSPMGLSNWGVDEAAFVRPDSTSGRDGDYEPDVYAVEANLLEPQMYDVLLEVLEAHGIDDVFVGGLVRFCGVYEHKLYLKFLSNLKDFVDVSVE